VTDKTLRVGTRGSRLALAQTALVVEALRDAGFDGPIDTVVIRTTGDAVSEQRPRGTWEDADGQFTGELETALLAGEIDLAVHSQKDLPTASTAGVEIAAVLRRGDARDCLVTRPADDGDVPQGARIGTSSVRRAVQLTAARPDIEVLPIRGNVDTRMRRLDDGEYDALLLAAAGLERLGTERGGVHPLDYDVMLPAPGQGALALQTRSEDADLRSRLSAVDHGPTRTAVDVERALLRAVGGGCLAPLGAFAEADTDGIRLRATYGETAESLHRVDLRGRLDDPVGLAQRAASELRTPADASAPR
jgi:hydroxymethylbilane synthase